MPNWCFGEMLVKGTKENKQKFIDLFLSHNPQENENKKRYFARTWLNTDVEVLKDNLECEVSSIFFECAWSVYSCMVDGYPQQYDKCPTIFEISKELELEIQVASEEGGMCFREFYHIDNGEVITQECEDFPESEFDAEELYEKYLEEWNKTHNEGEPVCYDEWCDLEYQEMRDNWYNEVYDKLTLF
jgi:hypothetical protein